uniref:Uncharacterized protein n=1 Tax=Timema cristinae TaxID=61476 RepID=A0A7R9CZP5_TIMCR|nr:unnamed protein product [Timema cristinae]
MSLYQEVPLSDDPCRDITRNSVRTTRVKLRTPDQRKPQQDSARTRTLLVMSYTLNVRSEEPLLRATEEDVQYILDSFGLKPQTIINAVEHLQEWMRLQPHLPKVSGLVSVIFWFQPPLEYMFSCSDPELLCRIWFRRKTSMELAKQVIDMYYTMRTLTPEFLTDRDPTSRHMQEAMKYM